MIKSSVFTGNIRRASEILQASNLTDEDECSHDEENMLHNPQGDQKVTEILWKLRWVRSNDLLLNHYKHCEGEVWACLIIHKYKEMLANMFIPI